MPAGTEFLIEYPTISYCIKCEPLIQLQEIRKS